jgi:hypothetical protein
MRAEILTVRCRQDAGLFGLRTEQRPDSWHVTWSFVINESSVRREKYGDTVINGTIQIDPGFPLCPRCGADTFVQCGTCEQLSCWMRGEPQWYCKWAPCTAFGTPSGQIQSVAARGDR